jgi:hypothetical protein
MLREWMILIPIFCGIVLALAVVNPVQSSSSSTDLRNSTSNVPKSMQCFGSVTGNNPHDANPIMCGKTGSQSYDMNSRCNSGEVMIGMHQFSSWDSDQELCASHCATPYLDEIQCQWR